MNRFFVPILTVMAEYGNAPFLWRMNGPDDGGVGSNLCDGSYWDESFPISEGLWRELAAWAIEFDRTAVHPDDFNVDDWDWLAFHACGLQLSRWLKDEVGEAYRVVYKKPFEDPNHRLDERVEMLANGACELLPASGDHAPEPRRFCERIISGGQTGADRGALDFAIRCGYVHGGWAPRGRQAEDGPIPMKYQLSQMTSGGYRQRTRQNVQDSDGTLIVNSGELEGGSLATRAFAQQHAKPFLVIQVDSGITGTETGNAIAWLRQHAIKTLNVAGPRESKRPGIYRQTIELLDAVDATYRSE